MFLCLVWLQEHHPSRSQIFFFGLQRPQTSLHGRLLHPTSTIVGHKWICINKYINTHTHSNFEYPVSDLQSLSLRRAKHFL